MENVISLNFTKCAKTSQNNLTNSVATVVHIVKRENLWHRQIFSYCQCWADIENGYLDDNFVLISHLHRIRRYHTFFTF